MLLFEAFLLNISKDLAMENIINAVEEKQLAKLNVGVFFDGTGQNANNLLAAKEKDERKLSNIYRLYKNYGKNDNEDLTVYIEGAGTKNGEGDNTLVQAMGVDIPRVTTGYGVFAKYSNSILQIAEQIRKSLPQADSGGNTLSLTFDVFGYSRGAATARHFVNMVNSLDISVTSILTKVAQEKGYEINKSLEVRFLGLYDTVASIWHLGTFWEDPHDTGDTHGLKVTLGKNAAKTVFQLTAKHECRYNFPLSSVAGNYFELELPGAHSDIGGSYASQENEISEVTQAKYGIPILSDTKKKVTDELAQLRKDSKWNILLKNTDIVSGSLPAPYHQGVSRRNVSGDLQYVSLMLMLKAAINKGCPFSDEAMTYENKIPGDLNEYYQNALLVSEDILIGKDTKIDQKIIDEMTTRYIHLSSSWQNLLWPWGYAPEGLSQEIKPEGVLKPRAAIDNYQPNRPDTGWQRKIFNSW